jgi:integrase
MPSHILKRGSVYTYRRRIPQHLQADYSGRAEVTRTLKTKDRADALRLARALSVQLDQEWTEKAAQDRQTEAATLPLPELARPGIRSSDTRKAPACLEDIIEVWKRERNPEPKTVDAYTRAVIEANNPPVTIDRKGLVAIRDQWLAKGNSIATTSKKCGFLRTLLGVAKARGLIKENPGDGIELPPEKRAVERRMPYTPEQAKSVMDATAHLSGADYWLPRLAKWTGARLEELHQLRRQDIVTRNGHPGIRITNEDGLRLKNTGSRRWVPLHSELLPFLLWAQGQQDGTLFQAKPDVHGILSASYSKRYGRLLRQKARITDSRVTFHSWRHTWADMARASGMSPDIRHAIMGHQEEGIAGMYGSGELPAGLLADAVAMLKPQV